MKSLRKVIPEGWPPEKSDVPELAQPYFSLRDELVLEEELVFKGRRLVVPAAVCQEMMAMIHSTHIGIEGCLRRARESLFWSRMSTELKEYISKCDICLAHRSSPGLNQYYNMMFQSGYGQKWEWTSVNQRGVLY